MSLAFKATIEVWDVPCTQPCHHTDDGPVWQGHSSNRHTHATLTAACELDSRLVGKVLVQLRARLWWVIGSGSDVQRTRATALGVRKHPKRLCKQGKAFIEESGKVLGKALWLGWQEHVGARAMDLRE